MYDVLIDRLDHQGRGIGYIDGKIVFVKNALPGENVKVKVVHENRKFYEAVVVEYYSNSSDRVSVDCPYYEFCGGCDIMHMSYSFQHDYKINKVKDIIRKFVKNDIDVVDISYDNQFNYRNKATFHVKEGIGYFKEKTYDLIEIDKCMISSLEINNVLNILKKMDLSGIEQVVVRSSYFDKSVMVIFHGDRFNEKYLVDSLKDFVSNFLFFPFTDNRQRY